MRSEEGEEERQEKRTEERRTAYSTGGGSCPTAWWTSLEARERAGKTRHRATARAKLCVKNARVLFVYDSRIQQYRLFRFFDF